MNKDNLVIFTDTIGRLIVGETVSDESNTLVVKNPAMVNIIPNSQNGQIQVQTMPFFFPEFLSEKKREVGSNWSFNKLQIVVSDVGPDDLDGRLIEQYEKIFAAPSLIQTSLDGNTPVTLDNPKTVKLFDD
tara:strand:- start:5546 stop:5938 length:393 start_codon:yes stop_codon:yes gene_type:complete